MAEPLFISNRGNLFGPQPEVENSPLAITLALKAGFHVKVDVHWDVEQAQWWLGRNEQHYDVDEMLLLDPRIWCRACDVEALSNLLEIGAHCFAHAVDPWVITSHGFVWYHPAQAPPASRGVLVLPERFSPRPLASWQYLAGVCTDYVYRYLGEYHAHCADSLL